MIWPVVPLSKVADIERDGISPEAIGDGTLYLGLEHIESGGRIIEVKKVENGDLASTKFKFGPKHILYGKLRPYLAKIATPDFAGVCSTDILPILPGPQIDRSYLKHFLRQPSQVEIAKSRSAGANLPRLSPGELAKFEVPLPPLAEQERISTILDAADALRAKRRAVLAKLDTLAQSLFIEMFGDATTVEKRSLASVCDLITDGTHYTPTYAESGVVFLSAKNVTRRRIDWEDVKHIPESLHLELQRRVSPRLNDVLLAKNGTTGVAALVDRECVFDIYVSLALLRPGPGILPKYLLEALNSDETRRQFDGSLKGIGVSNLHLVDIRSATIPLPSCEAQAAFVAKIESLEKLRSAYVLGVESSNHLFASLQHRAFRGELTAIDAKEIAA